MKKIDLLKWLSSINQIPNYQSMTSIDTTEITLDFAHQNRPKIATMEDGRLLHDYPLITTNPVVMRHEESNLAIMRAARKKKLDDSHREFLRHVGRSVINSL
jgi:hypothetical protein